MYHAPADGVGPAMDAERPEGAHQARRHHPAAGAARGAW